jgi:hypothetical protein
MQGLIPKGKSGLMKFEIPNNRDSFAGLLLMVIGLVAAVIAPPAGRV